MHFSKRLRTEWQDTCGNLCFTYKKWQEVVTAYSDSEKKLLAIERGLSELSFFPHKGSGIVVN